MLIAYTDRAYICENTGSRKGYREWFFGAQTNRWYRASELELFFIDQHPKKLQHRWTSYGGTGSSLIPFMKSHGHGSPGLILSPTQEMFDSYVRSLSSEKRLELYHDLSSADDDAISSWVESIYEYN